MDGGTCRLTSSLESRRISKNILRPKDFISLIKIRKYVVKKFNLFYDEAYFDRIPMFFHRIYDKNNNHKK